MFDTADVKSCHTVCNPICKHSFYFLKIQFFQFAPLLNETAKRWKNDLPDCKSKLSSSVVLSAPTILWPRVRIPSTPSMLFSICIEIVMRKRTKIKKKRPGLAHFLKKNYSHSSHPPKKIKLGPLSASFNLLSSLLPSSSGSRTHDLTIIGC